MSQSLELTPASRRLTVFERGLALAACGAIAGVWLLALYLTPDPRGLGTHEQLGLAPCGMIAFFGIPCAFCGMTTAFTQLARGELLAAFATQPAAVFIAIGTIPAGFVAFTTMVSGRYPKTFAETLTSRRALQAGAAVLVLAWVYKVIAYL